MRIFVITKKTLILLGCVLFAVIAGLIVWLCLLDGSAVATGASVVEEYERTVLAGRRKEVPVYSVQREDKKIALTIDAAWEDDKTEYILETLARYDVKATFFLCGFWVKTYPEMTRAIAAAGHSVGNHTDTHPHMSGMGEKAIEKELAAFEERVEPLAGKRCTLFRAPYGEYDDNVIRTVRGLGYEVIQWNLDTVDWREERSAQTILDSVLPKLAPGSIILCHNNGYKIKEYLPTLLETAKAQGYEFVTVDELLLDGNTVVDVNGVQKAG